MPVIDWVRTDLDYPLDDGSSTTFFDKIRFAYFDCRILERAGAENDYIGEEMRRVRELDKTIAEKEKNALINTIIIKTQGFISGNFKKGDRNPVALFKRLLAFYDGINNELLRKNLQYFLEQIIPVCEEYGVNMCIHPDDPPYQMFGLPRIVTGRDDICRILQAVDNPHNGLTFCSGSLSAGLHNDLPQLAEEFASRTHFLHLRSTHVFDNGNFIEASHLEGRGHLIELVRIFEKKNPGLPMRVDHGRLMLDDKGKNYNPGYSFLGRMFALAQMDGVIATVKDELQRNLI